MHGGAINLNVSWKGKLPNRVRRNCYRGDQTRGKQREWGRSTVGKRKPESKK